MFTLQSSRQRGPIFALCLGLLLTIFSTLLASPTVNGQGEPIAACATPNVLLVVSALTLESRDAMILARLTQQGYQVEVKTGKRVTAADANGKALVIVSESVVSDDVNNKFRDVAIPLLTWEGWLYDNLRMTGAKNNQDYGEITPETQVRVVDPNHPLAAGLTGDVALLNNSSATDERKFHWGAPSANAVVIAVNRKGNQYAHIFAYEQGASMVGLVAPARRVGFPNGSAQRFTTEGWRLFNAAVAWAVACPNASTPTATPVDPAATPTPTFVSTTPPTLPATTTTPTTPAATATSPAPATPTATRRPGEATATPAPTLSAAQLTVTKIDFLYTDADQNDLVSGGDTMLYAIKINNLGGKAAYQIRLVDPPDPNSTLLVGTVTTDGGNVIKGNSAGDAHVVIEVPELAGGGQVLISFQAQVNTPNSQTSLQNQAITTFVDQVPEPRAQMTVVSDDPDTADGPDTTITILNAPLTQLNRKLFLPVMGR